MELGSNRPLDALAGESLQGLVPSGLASTSLGSWKILSSLSYFPCSAKLKLLLNYYESGIMV
ncbi:unnamed protein product [Clavelina lepadiformis]|uniref:Uncharacterized protein n=1 Tax=Clavelina lepadiformis TaxID=159417 RepID=A0ABP0GF49_CLALP